MAVVNGGKYNIMRIASLSLVNSWEVGVSHLGVGGRPRGIGKARVRERERGKWKRGELRAEGRGNG